MPDVFSGISSIERARLLRDKEVMEGQTRIAPINTAWFWSKPTVSRWAPQAWTKDLFSKMCRFQTEPLLEESWKQAW
ncbi:hypothetical protein HBH69_105650 [Parastagonospora nodorum]|nr:hypothetical protein HBH89_124880 [Parastagonospora nodorum]KAH4875448.1 hypothetical protein HBH58_116140 [Parastagonospora nodorum]KAH5013853.1 hypothetical protein HBI75_192440 [Parastagonospora nodorum]KAH5155530.1 hypothetical protein HBH69_105650 [Parastagonospora nodorum]KAH6213600.1 hypothetical protein HBI53_106930 [Parastagonospora nodorum]